MVGEGGLRKIHVQTRGAEEEVDEDEDGKF